MQLKKKKKKKLLSPVKMTFKQKIKSHYQKPIVGENKRISFMISDLAQDAQNDAKGSAGDKHETALSMMHLEQENSIKIS